MSKPIRRNGLAVVGLMLTVLVVLMWLVVDHRARAQPITITLDPSTTYQTMTGWEVTADLADEPDAPSWAAVHDETMQRAVSEVGINRLRLELRAGAEDNSGAVSRFIAGDISYEDWRDARYQAVKDNDDPTEINWDGFNFAELDWHIEGTVVPMRDMLAAQGERLHINLCYVAFRSGWYIHKDPEEYAELVLATYLHMRDTYGFVPDTWEVILEPDQMPDQWSGDNIGRAIVAAARRLEANGFTPAFIAPSVMDMENAVPYLQEIANVPGAMQYLTELSYHPYEGRNPHTVKHIAKTAAEFDVQASMLEWWFGRATPKVLHGDLKNGNVAAWQGRVLHTLFEYDEGAAVRLRPQEDVRYTLQYFRDVRMGAVRIKATSSRKSRMDPLAFVNPDGSTTVVIRAKRAGEFVFEGLPEGRYQVSYAVEQASVMLPNRISVGPSGDLNTRIPGAGVLTITAR